MADEAEAVTALTGGAAAASPWLAAIPAAMGVVQGIGGLLGLRKLKKQATPVFTEDSAMAASRNKANAAAQFGFSPEQTAAYNAQQSQLNNSRWQRAMTQGGGNQSRAVSAGLNYGNIGAQLNFAAKDASLQQEKTRYADTFSRNLQDLRNRNTANAYNYRMQSEQALGKAVQSGFNNLATGAMMFGVSGGFNGKNNTPNSLGATTPTATIGMNDQINTPAANVGANVASGGSYGGWGSMNRNAPANPYNSLSIPMESYQ